MQALGSGLVRPGRDVRLANSGTPLLAPPSTQPTSGLARVLDAFLGTGRRSLPLQRPVRATQGDDLGPGQLRLESDFRLGEHDVHHLRLDVENHASGSSQFTAAGLRTLRAAVERAQPGARIVVVDLRQESHGLLHGEPIEWMGPQNQANRGKSPTAICADEQRRLSELGGQTEAEVCAGEGLEYVRLPVTDHLTPDDATVRQFLRLAERLEREGAWVHFHCKAGRGRTTTFMALWELFRGRRGLVDVTRVAERQRDLGGVDLLKAKPLEEDGGSSTCRRDLLLRFPALARGDGERARP